MCQNTLFLIKTTKIEVYVLYEQALNIFIYISSVWSLKMSVSKWIRIEVKPYQIDDMQVSCVSLFDKCYVMQNFIVKDP